MNISVIDAFNKVINSNKCVQRTKLQARRQLAVHFSDVKEIDPLYDFTCEYKAALRNVSSIYYQNSADYFYGKFAPVPEELEKIVLSIPNELVILGYDIEKGQLCLSGEKRGSSFHKKEFFGISEISIALMRSKWMVFPIHFAEFFDYLLYCEDNNPDWKDLFRKLQHVEGQNLSW